MGSTGIAHWRKLLKFRVAIVGLGAIGQGYDYAETPSTQHKILTHASAFSQHPGFNLVAGVDSNLSARDKFVKKFSSPAYKNIEELHALSPDIITISTPTTTHATVIEQCLKLHPRLILLEKPLGTTLAESQTIIAATAAANCILAVNFFRRFEPGIIRLKTLINAGAYGKIRKAVVWYAKGLLNNGSHFVDLCRYLLGEPSNPHIIRTGRKLSENDAEPDFIVNFGDSEVTFLAGHEEDFSLKEITFMAEKGIIQYEQGGERISFRPTALSDVFSGYKVLQQNTEQISTDFFKYQWHVADQIYNFLLGSAVLASDGDSALKTQHLVDNILQARKSFEEHTNEEK